MKLHGIAFLINLIIFRVRNRWTICLRFGHVQGGLVRMCA